MLRLAFLFLLELVCCCPVGELPRKGSGDGRGSLWGEQCRPAFHGAPGGSAADVREPCAGRWAAVTGLGVLEEGRSGAVPRAGGS